MSKTRNLLRGQRGDGKIGAVIALIVVALAVHVGMKFIPFKVQTAEFEKAVEDNLLDLAANLKKEDDFRRVIVERAEEMELPVTDENIQLELQGSTWKFKVEYEVVLGMVWGDWVQTIEIERERTKL